MITEKRMTYRERENQLKSQQQRQLEDEHGLTGHPKADLLYSMAWEDGHYAGFNEVANIYGHLAQLLK